LCRRLIASAIIAATTAPDVAILISPSKNSDRQIQFHRHAPLETEEALFKFSKDVDTSLTGQVSCESVHSPMAANNALASR
jgi:hypothetical protein